MNDVERIVMTDPAKQIKAWIDGFAEQKEFWEVVVYNGTWANLNKTEEEAKHLISYYEGRYDTALLFRDFVAQKTIES